MPQFMMAFVRIVDRFNYLIGRFMMYTIFLLIAILAWSTISKQLFVVPAFWTMEAAQFVLVAYYLVGGAYSIQLGSNVRMDLFYGDWSERKKAWVDCFTVLFLIFYLGVLLTGGINSTLYAIQYSELSPSLWRPLMWPIKSIMCFGIFLMLLQSISELIKDIAKLRGVQI
ncbi:MAG: TRAP-type mannitol/chloroaromatic compound transport system permease small subunit [Gammaproteobacteria bacterium]|jgi:TRAP-type mannitol/chloroaromatic compound transport system permease small subunit